MTDPPSERTDTERLDWLEHRANHPSKAYPDGGVFNSPFLCAWEEDESLRQAIDAAMDAEEEEDRR
jgi:hypothetical protein